MSMIKTYYLLLISKNNLQIIIIKNKNYILVSEYNQHLGTIALVFLSISLIAFLSSNIKCLLLNHIVYIKSSY